ncbi:MAG TPA: DUF882 domain-containing protein [Polyangia bacterium]
MSARTYIANRKRSHMPPRFPTWFGTLAVLGVLPFALPSTRQAAASRVAPVVAVAVAAPVVFPQPALAPAVKAGIVVEPIESQERPVKLENVNTKEKATFRIGPRGYVRAEQLAAVQHFFRCRRTDREAPISPGVLAMLGDVAERFPGRVIEVVSGFRAPPFGVPHSRHFKGHAIDLRVRGVRTSVVRDFLWREHRGLGVGFYAEENFVHVDYRPEDQEIAWSARHESSAPEYNPRWAKRARRGLPKRPAMTTPELALAGPARNRGF